MQGNTGRTSQKADSVAVAELRRQARELCDLVRANRIGDFVTLLARDRADIEGLAAGLTGPEAERLRAIDREFLLEAARDKNESARSYMHFLLSSTCPWGARCRPIDAGTANRLFAEAAGNGNVHAVKTLAEHKDVGPLIDIGLEANGLMHCLAQSLGHAGHLQVLEYLVRESPLRGRFASGFLPELLEAARGGRLLDPLAWTALVERFEIRDAARLPAPARQETRVLGPKEKTREETKEEPMKTTKETPPVPAGRNAWKSDRKKGEEFELAGRAELARRLNDEVVDLALHPEAYKPFGIKAPASMLFYGEPGCGKTYAVNRLVEFLGWKRVEITASDVYCSEAHQSNIRKRFREAFIAAERGERAVVVMDELDTFLIRRDEVGRNPWVVEEVNEFLTCLQEAHDKGVLVIGMCNEPERLDPAALRPGRFDLHIGVEKPTREEARELIEAGLAKCPLDPGLDLEPILDELSGKSVAEVTLLLNRARRLAAEQDKEALDQDCLEGALKSCRADRAATRKYLGPIGF